MRDPQLALDNVDASELMQLLKPYLADEMKVVPESTMFYNLTIDSAELICPVQLGIGFLTHC